MQQLVCTVATRLYLLCGCRTRVYVRLMPAVLSVACLRRASLDSIITLSTNTHWVTGSPAGYACPTARMTVTQRQSMSGARTIHDEQRLSRANQLTRELTRHISHNDAGTGARDQPARSIQRTNARALRSLLSRRRAQALARGEDSPSVCLAVRCAGRVERALGATRRPAHARTHARTDGQSLRRRMDETAALQLQGPAPPKVKRIVFNAHAAPLGASSHTSVVLGGPLGSHGGLHESKMARGPGDRYIVEATKLVAKP